ncbi:MAG: DUF503 domain-containing protein, partial [Armatimonadota bacterium]
MVVGTLRVELFIADGVTLKDKRRVLRSLLDRIRHRFNVAAAEVDRQDARHAAVIGAACVANSSAHSSRIVDSVIRFIESEPRVSIVDCQTEYV